MNKSKIILVTFIGICCFAFGLITSTLVSPWRKVLEHAASVNLSPEATCQYNLKSLWIIARRASRIVKHFDKIWVFVQQSVKGGKRFLILPDEAKYLNLPSKVAGTYKGFHTALICPKDPDYLFKVAMDTQGLDYQPSYLWHPDARTLAYCPYCGLAVLLDGKLEKRSEPKP